MTRGAVILFGSSTLVWSASTNVIQTNGPTLDFNTNRISIEVSAKEDGESKLQTARNWLPLGVSVLNLLFVGLVYFRAARHRREDHRDREILLRLEITKFWIQKMILEPNLERLNAFFTSCDANLTATRNKKKKGDQGKSAKDAIEEFNSHYRALRSYLVEPLLIASSKFDPLLETIEAIQDLVTQQIALTPGVLEESQTANAQEKMADLRNNFLGHLYRCQTSIISLEAERDNHFSTKDG